MWEFVLYQNAPRPGSWQAEGLTEGEQLAALGSSELFPFRLLITFAATTLVGIWSPCFAAACNAPLFTGRPLRCIPRSGRSAAAPSPANHISIGGKKLGIGPGSAHKVVARWRRGACLQLPVLELLRFAASSTGRAQLRNVAGQLGGSRPGKRNKYQISQKQTARFCVLLAFVVSGSYLSSRAVASQVLSAYKGLTSVFGMGTGGTPWLNHRNGYGVFSTHLENCIAFQFASIKPSTY